MMCSCPVWNLAAVAVILRGSITQLPWGWLTDVEGGNQVCRRCQHACFASASCSLVSQRLGFVTASSAHMLEMIFVKVQHSMLMAATSTVWMAN